MPETPGSLISHGNDKTTTRRTARSSSSAPVAGMASMVTSSSDLKDGYPDKGFMMSIPSYCRSRRCARRSERAEGAAARTRLAALSRASPRRTRSAATTPSTADGMAGPQHVGEAIPRAVGKARTQHPRGCLVGTGRVEGKQRGAEDGPRLDPVDSGSRRLGRQADLDPRVEGIVACIEDTTREDDRRIAPHQVRPADRRRRHRDDLVCETVTIARATASRAAAENTSGASSSRRSSASRPWWIASVTSIGRRRPKPPGPCARGASAAPVRRAHEPLPRAPRPRAPGPRPSRPRSRQAPGSARLGRRVPVPGS